MNIRQFAARGVQIARQAGGKIAVGATAVVATASAHAAGLPAEATQAFSDLSSGANSMLSNIWPIVSVVAAGFALIRLFKRGTSAAV